MESDQLIKKSVGVVISIPLVVPLCLMMAWPVMLYASIGLWDAHESVATWKDPFYASIMAFYPIPVLFGLYFCTRGIVKGIPLQSALGTVIGYIPFACFTLFWFI
ncbi:hypothetical protein [Arsukibacterium sp.]|uniref:hypothetical protein n=1 Tax=Arsukibacterium sp. TaxID=1977258 RepID=UPI001BD63580|nr:hypothetical protein [Arsukibacterium sp.]